MLTNYFGFGRVGFGCFVHKILNKLPNTSNTLNNLGLEMPEHLAQGSTEPPPVPGKLRLYGMRFCPYDHRVHLVLQAKSIPHDNVWINLRDKPDWFVKRIPSTKVPGLLVGEGESLYESLIIADYLDEKYSQRPLHSRDPLRKARDRIMVEEFGKVGGAFYKLVMSKPSPAPENFDALIAELAKFDEELAIRGTTYFGGAEPGMLDYMIWPWFERFAALKIAFGNQFDLPQDKLKHLVLWIGKMNEDHAVKEYLIKAEPHAQFMKSFAAGAPDFNIPI